MMHKDISTLVLGQAVEIEIIISTELVKRGLDKPGNNMATQFRLEITDMADTGNPLRFNYQPHLWMTALKWAQWIDQYDALMVRINEATDPVLKKALLVEREHMVFVDYRKESR